MRLDKYDRRYNNPSYRYAEWLTLLMHVLFIQNLLFYRFIGCFLLEFDNYIVIYVFSRFFNRRVNSKAQNFFTDASPVFPLQTNSSKFKNPQSGSSAY